MKKVKIGIVGVGYISGIYLENLTNMFDNTEVIASSDLRPEATKAAREKWGLEIMTNEELISSPEIDIVLNLTTTDAHYSICKQALEAGKHVYVEKPLSITFKEGKELFDLAKEKGLMLGGAPDTFLGAGIQTCRTLIEDGRIGKIVGACAFMMNRGHEGWHPNPDFYYQYGGGPMLDMGPYYLTALVSLMGGVNEVCGFTNISFETRTIKSEPRAGEIIKVEVPTYVSGILRFASGAIGNIITSFDVSMASLPFIEIYGSLGSIKVPDPNTFGGPVFLSTGGEEYKEVPLTHNYTENSRGLGVSDMAKCIIDGRIGQNRANGQLTSHVLEIMEAIHSANDTKNYYKITTVL